VHSTGKRWFATLSRGARMWRKRGRGHWKGHIEAFILINKAHEKMTGMIDVMEYITYSFIEIMASWLTVPGRVGRRQRRWLGWSTVKFDKRGSLKRVKAYKRDGFCAF
jgi:hypothetical protein